MRVNWVRLFLGILLVGLVFTDANGISYELVRLFKLVYFMFGVLMFGLAFEVK